MGAKWPESEKSFLRDLVKTEKEELLVEEASLGIAAEQLEVSKAILHELRSLHPKPLTALIGVRFTGDTMAFNTLSLNVGQTSTASIVPLLADAVTPSQGAVSNVSYTFSDPSATVVLNPDGQTALVTGVAASTAPVNGTATCTVTDTDGVVSTWTQSFTISVAGAVTPPSQLTQSIGVSFTTPTP